MTPCFYYLYERDMHMSMFDEHYCLIAGPNTVGAFKSEKEIQYHLVNLSLGELCPVTIIYPDYSNDGGYRRVDTLRAYDFYVCNCRDDHQTRAEDCDALCMNIAECLDKINLGENQNCLATHVNNSFVFRSTEDGIEYLQFICPISNLIKFAFPIKYKNQVVCTIFVGQYSISAQPKTIRSSFTKSKNASCTRENHIGSKQFESETLLIRYIHDAISPEILNITKVIDENIRADIQQRIQGCLQTAEQNLSEAMVEVLAYDCASDMEDYATNVLNLFWQAVRSSYESFFINMSFSNVLLFTNDDFSSQDTIKRNLNSTILFHHYDSSPNIALEKLALDHISASQLCASKGERILASSTITKEELATCLLNAPQLLLEGCDFVFANNGIKSPYAILINHNISKINQEAIINSAKQIAANINYEMVSVLSKLSEHATKSILRIYRHEIVHQILALRTSLSALNPDYAVHLPQEKIANIFRDCSDCLFELSFMTENIKLFTGWSGTTAFGMGEAQTSKEIDIFRDVLNKHIVMHREVRKNKNLWFEVLGKTEDTHTISCHPLLLDLLLFNIISNAVKYSYAGTNIWFKYSTDSDKHNVQRLTICDYGPGIATDDSVYKLYYRGPDLANVETGSGIGLFLSRRLSTMMGITLYHECKKVSNYNVALMDAYIACVNDQDLIKHPELPAKKTVVNELLRLKKQKVYTQIVNKNIGEQKKEPSKAQILADITLPTFEVSFVLEI